MRATITRMSSSCGVSTQCVLSALPAAVWLQSSMWHFCWMRLPLLILLFVHVSHFHMLRQVCIKHMLCGSCVHCFSAQKEEKQDASALLNPAERVAAVRPMWEQRQHDDRVQLLTVDLDTLRQQAKAVPEKQRAHAGVQDILQPGVAGSGSTSAAGTAELCSLTDVKSTGMLRGHCFYACLVVWSDISVHTQSCCWYLVAVLRLCCALAESMPHMAGSSL